MPAKVRKHVWIKGAVQGVNYRYTASQEAMKRRLGGWVRNLPDGRVEACFEGEESAVADMLAWCRQGPPNAKVEAIEEKVEPLDNDPRFRVMR